MRLVIVTGMSGAGKSSALKMLEDMGYFCVDNLPVQLVPKLGELLIVPGTEINKIALGMDIRSGQGIDDLEQFIVENEVQIAALTIPKSKAPEIADRLVKAGIKAIWNFAHTDLRVPKDIIVENVHLSESLMRLSYNIVHRDKVLK